MREGSSKFRENKDSIGSLWKPGYVEITEFREAPNKVLIRPRFKGNILIKEVNIFKAQNKVLIRPRSERNILIKEVNFLRIQRLCEIRTHKEALIMATNRRAL